MPNKCCVPGCKTNYYEREDVSVHVFPRDEEGRREWIKAIGRPPPWEPTKNSRVCGRHFWESDYRTESADKHHYRRRKRLAEGLLKKALYDDAVPSIFPGGPMWKQVMEKVKKERLKNKKKPKWMSELPFCVVQECTNDVMDLAKGVAFFSFPEDPMLREHWGKMCGHDKKWTPPPVARLCRDHFDPTLNLAGPAKQNSVPVQLAQLQPLAQVLAPPNFPIQSVHEEPKIKLVRSLRSCNIWRIFNEYYKSNLFCDLKIVCKTRKKDLPINEGSLHCHRLILASISPMLADAMVAVPYEELSVVYLFDHYLDHVRSAIDHLYVSLARECEPKTLMEGKFAEVFSDLGVVWEKFDRFAEVECTAERIRNEHDYNDDWTGRDDVRANEDGFEAEKTKLDHLEVNEEPQVLEKRVMKRRLEEDQAYGWDDSPTKKAKEDCINQCILQEAADLRERVSEKKDACIDVTILGNPYLPEYTCAAKKRKSLVMIMFGLRSTEKDLVYDAFPIVISPKFGERAAAEKVQESFLKFRSVIRSVFGLSQVEATYQTTIFSRMEVSGRARMSQIKYDLKRRFANCTDEELRGLLTEEILSVNEKGPIRPFFGDKISMQKQKCTQNLKLKISFDIGIESLEGIALVTYEENGKKLAYSFNVEDQTRDADIQKLFKAFFDVFVANTSLTVADQNILCVPRVETIINEAKALEHAGALFLMVNEYLGDVDRTKRNSLSGLGSRMCEDCGVAFDIKTLQDITCFQQHRRKHFYENYKCNCNLSFKSIVEKKSHVQLAHMKGYSLCPHCGFVSKGSALKMHQQEKHERFACDQCGETIIGRTPFGLHMSKEHGDDTALTGIGKPGQRRRHVLRQRREKWGLSYSQSVVNKDRYIPTSDYNPHPDHSKELKRTDPCVDCGKVYDRPIQLYAHWRNAHLEVKCGDCGQVGIGDSFRRSHSRKVHPMDKDLQVNCKDCGKTIANKRKMLVHYYTVDAPESERPYQCKQCDRRFGSHSLRWSHEKRVHSSDRAYSCRYKGCTSSYKDPGDRSSHENKKHGKCFAKLQHTTDA